MTRPESLTIRICQGIIAAIFYGAAAIVAYVILRDISDATRWLL